VGGFIERFGTYLNTQLDTNVAAAPPKNPNADVTKIGRFGVKDGDERRIRPMDIYDSPIGPVRFSQIMKNPNPELDLGFGSVRPVSPNLNWGPVWVRFRFRIGSEPDTGNTSRWTILRRLFHRFTPIPITFLCNLAHWQLFQQAEHRSPVDFSEFHRESSEASGSRVPRLLMNETVLAESDIES
jgi:hypothetical protein